MTTPAMATTLVGQLAMESTLVEGRDGQGHRMRFDYRPAGVILRNDDGRWRYWQHPGEDYEVRHDGTGWRVTCQTWDASHTYRLATPSGELTDRLPGQHEVITLRVGTTYALRGDGHGAWALYNLG